MKEKNLFLTFHCLVLSLRTLLGNLLKILRLDRKSMLCAENTLLACCEMEGSIDGRPLGRHGEKVALTFGCVGCGSGSFRYFKNFIRGPGVRFSILPWVLHTSLGTPKKPPIEEFDEQDCNFLC